MPAAQYNGYGTYRDQRRRICRTGSHEFATTKKGTIMTKQSDGLELRVLARGASSFPAVYLYDVTPGGYWTVSCSITTYDHSIAYYQLPPAKAGGLPVPSSAFEAGS